jgi:hypothetical protein
VRSEPRMGQVYDRGPSDLVNVAWCVGLCRRFRHAIDIGANSWLVVRTTQVLVKILSAGQGLLAVRLSVQYDSQLCTNMPAKLPEVTGSIGCRDQEVAGQL